MGIFEDMAERIAQLEARIDRLEGERPGAGAYSWAKTMADIAQAVAHHYGLAVADLRGRDRNRRVAWPRQEAMLAMSRAGFTNGQIGLYLGRDTSTVCDGIAAARARQAGQAVLKAQGPESIPEALLFDASGGMMRVSRSQGQVTA